MKRIIVPLLLIISLYSQAQNDTDHLEPLGGLLGIYDEQFINPTIIGSPFEKFPETPEVRFVIIPSLMSIGSVLDIYYDNPMQKHYIIYRRYETGESNLTNEEKQKIGYVRFKKEIDSLSVEKIKSLFSSAIDAARINENKRLGRDGVFYYFSVNDRELKTGRVWSPKKDTKMKALVDVGENLIKLVKKKKSTSITFDSKFISQIEKLQKEL